MNQSEESLIEKVKQGDEHAFHVLYEKYQPMLFRSVYYRTRNEGLAGDVVQETFLKVWVNRDRLVSNLAFYAYLSKLSKNLVLDHYKREEVRTRHKDHVTFLEDKPSRDPEQEMQHDAFQKKIREVVDGKLPDKCRSIFLLSRVEGMNNQEIADILNVTKKTVENQLYRALKILRQKCEEYL